MRILFSSLFQLSQLLSWLLYLSFLPAATHADLCLAAESPAPTTLMTLESFLEQVKKNHRGIQAALQSQEAGQLRSAEGHLLYSPTAYANLKFGADAKIQPLSFLSYGNITTNSISIGVSQVTSFGLQGKVHYDLYNQNLNNPEAAPLLGSGSFSSSAAGYLLSYNNAAPVLELTQNLWSNGLGRSTRANETQIEASALATSYSASYQSKAALTEAETNYWRLAAARQTVLVETEALDRSQKIYAWNSRRAQLHLGDESDVLQAEALVKSRELDLLSARNQERAAALSVNTSRNIDSDQVPETLSELTPQMMDAIRTPTRAAMRDDVKAAEQSSRVSIARAQIATEQGLPSLDLVASAALNGQQAQGFNYADLGSAMGASFSLNRPTVSIALNFSSPLSFGSVSSSLRGLKLERISAELTLDRKLFEQEQSWKDLSQSLVEAKQRYELALKLEQVQDAKLTHEKERLKQGRTTTYQVLVFEQDFLLAQLTRIQNQVSILNFISQMKLFGESL